MTMKKLAILPAIVVVSACSGGGGGSNVGSSGTPSVEVLETFSDGSGVARVTDGSGDVNVTGNVLGANINSYQIDPNSVADLSSLSYDFSNAFGDFYRGPITINGTRVDAIAFEDNATGAVALYAENSLNNALVVAGEEITSTPAGTFTYQGTNLYGNRDGSDIAYGTFTLEADFNNGTGALSGSTPRSTIGGDINIDTSTGEFSGNSLSLTDDLRITTGSARINGNFHGSGATGVTGIYTENAANPSTAGAIVGSR